MALGLGGNIMNMMFGDPDQEASDLANQDQARNRAALGEDAQGNLLPTPAPGSAPGVGSGQIAPPMGAAPPGPGEPNATQTPKSWGSVLMDLQRRDEASQGLNQSLGMGFAAFAQPRDREMVSKMFNVNAPNELQTVQGMQNMGSLQQGQDRMNALGQQIMDPKAGPAMADRLNISWDELKARYRADPQGTGNMIQSFATPTDQMRNLQQISTYQQQFAKDHPGASQDQLNNIAILLRAGVPGDKVQAMVLAQDAFRQKFGVDPSWKNNPDGFAVYQAQQGDRADALNKRPLSEGKIGDLENKVDSIENDKALPGLMKRLVPGQGILSLVGYNDAERNLLQKIKQATSDEYVRGLADPGLGTRKTQQEMTYVGQSLGGVLNATNINLPDYTAGLERLKDELYRTHADVYGQSGDFSGLDSKYHGYINDAYRPGGALNEGIVGAPARRPLDDEAMQFWKANQGKAPKAALIEHLRNLNYDTGKLQNGG